MIFRWAVVLLFCLVSLTVFVFRPYSFGHSIPQGWGFNLVESFSGQAFSPKPVSHTPVPQHPFLAPTNSATMHVESFNSDVHPKGGPIGVNPSVRSFAHAAFGGLCANIAYNTSGNLVAMCATFTNFHLLLISPETLRPIDSLVFPPRPSHRTLSLRKIMSDTSGGAYFYLDDQDRAVIVDAENKLHIVATGSRDEIGSLQVIETVDLNPAIRDDSYGHVGVVSALPDWAGNIWFVAQSGIVGVYSGEGEVVTYRIAGENISNSFAMDRDHAYVVTDHALYAFRLSQSGGEIEQRWRLAYERGTFIKPGTITVGSGTSPTLIGDEFIAIVTSSEPQAELIVIGDRRTSSPRVVCTHPLFSRGVSATQNSVVGIGNSVVIENNYGYDLFTTMMFGRTAEGGLERIDFDPDMNSCHTVWRSDVISQTTVPKLSAETGLVYVYAKSADAPLGVDAYYFSAIDFSTGRTAFQVLTGTGVSYDNNWAPIFLKDGGCAYVGVLRGLVEICDDRRQAQ